MWTLFLIITLNANSSYPDQPLYNQKSIMGGISSHEIASFEKLEDCAWEGLQLSARNKKQSQSGYIIEYKCIPTKTKSD